MATLSRKTTKHPIAKHCYMNQAPWDLRLLKYRYGGGRAPDFFWLLT